MRFVVVLAGNRTAGADGGIIEGWQFESGRVLDQVYFGFEHTKGMGIADGAVQHFCQKEHGRVRPTAAKLARQLTRFKASDAEAQFVLVNRGVCMCHINRGHCKQHHARHSPSQFLGPEQTGGCIHTQRKEQNQVCNEDHTKPNANCAIDSFFWNFRAMNPT